MLLCIMYDQQCYKFTFFNSDIITQELKLNFISQNACIYQQ